MKSIQSNRFSENRRRRRLLVATLIIAFVLLGFRVLAPEASSSFARGLLKPVWSLGGVLGFDISELQVSLRDKQELESENQNLKIQVDSYEAKILIFDRLMKKNEELEQALGRTPADRKALSAYILSKPPQSAYDSLVLDVGARDGVTINDYVYARDFIYLGRIDQVGKTTSSARLASSSGVETQAVIIPADIHLTISGVGGGAFEAELPTDITISKGDQIITRGSSPQIIGLVQEVTARPSDSFQTIRALSPLNISAVSWVSILQAPDLSAETFDTNNEAI